jgi:Xaa-Pro aminopeptidase
MTETQEKLGRLRALMAENQIDGVHLRGIDWFSWLTSGGTNVVFLPSETGIADLFITAKEAWILTNRIETRRLVDEEPTSDFRITDFNWQDSQAIYSFIKEKCGGPVVCDRPQLFEKPLPMVFNHLKWVLGEGDIERYRSLCRESAEAMTDALTLAKPEWTENQLAGEGAKALWSRGIEATLILIAGHDRGKIYRHPTVVSKPIGKSVMMVFSARRNGLYANITRFVYFNEPSASERATFEKLSKIEQQGLDAVQVGSTLKSVYSAFADAYRDAGVPEEINNHHQGGSCGYQSREVFANPSLPAEQDIPFVAGMAFAWNPSLPGAKLEDTILLTKNGIEILTVDPRWPTVHVGVRARPAWWVKA